MAPIAALEQVAPTNVNVSVRLDSPGDNGAVTQVNVAAVLDAGLPVTDTQYQPVRPQYQAPIPVAAGADDHATPRTAAVPAAAPASSPASGWNWTWTWNCGDAVPEIPIDPAVLSQNWTWNWNWNCDDAETTAGNTNNEFGDQYQPSVAQYRPININISIRINSPGNDGPVVQTNVAVAVTTTPPIQVPVVVPAPPTGGAQPGAAAPATATAPVAAAAEITMYFDVGVVEIAPAEAWDSDECCVLRPSRSTAAAAQATQSVVLRDAGRAARRDITGSRPLHTSLEATVRLAATVAAAAEPARRAQRKVRTARPAPRHHPSDPAREPTLALGAGLAPLSAPDGRFGYIVLLILAIGFVFAFADAARSVAAELRAAAGEPGPPPDHPG